jgi:hypothetical protein
VVAYARIALNSVEQLIKRFGYDIEIKLRPARRPIGRRTLAVALQTSSCAPQHTFLTPTTYPELETFTDSGALLSCPSVLSFSPSLMDGTTQGRR